MKKINEMTPEELFEYCYKLKLNGSNFRELANIFEQNNIEPEVRKKIIKGLDTVDKQQREEQKVKKRKTNTATAIKNLVIGITALVFGFLLYNLSSEVGAIFIFNFVVWGFGALMVLRGIVGLTKSE